MDNNFQEKLFDEDTDSGDDNVHGDVTGTVMRVLVPFPVAKAYDYAVPADMDVALGDYVTVPFAGREVIGVVWGDRSADCKPKKLKSMITGHDMPPMPAVQRTFIDWVSAYTMNAKGAVLKMALSAPAAFKPPKPIPACRIYNNVKLEGFPAKQQAVVDVMRDGDVRRASEIAELAGVGTGVVKTLMGKDILEPVALFNPAPCKKPDAYRNGADLSDEQARVAARLVAHVEDSAFHASLLDGVTGAGKTETYFEAVAAALKADKQVLILLPEIALSNAFLSRFQDRFGCAPALWHSHLSPAKRRDTWRGVAKSLWARFRLRSCPRRRRSRRWRIVGTMMRCIKTARHGTSICICLRAMAGRACRALR